MNIYSVNFNPLNSALNPLSKKMDIKEMVEKKIKDEWPNAKVNGETDTNEQEIRSVHQTLYEIEKQQMEEILAKESQQQQQLTHQCAEENLRQCLDEAKRARQSMTDNLIDPLPELEIIENHKSKTSMTLQFKQMRLNYALSYLVFVAAVVNNMHIFLTSASVNSIDDLLVIMTLTIIVMGFIFMVGRFAHLLMHGHRLERVMASLLGVSIVFILLIFYLSIANLLINGSLSPVDEDFLKTVYKLPTLNLVNVWIITGIALGLLTFILGLWNDNKLELLEQRARLNVIKNESRNSNNCRITKPRVLTFGSRKGIKIWKKYRRQYVIKSRR